MPLTGLYLLNSNYFCFKVKTVLADERFYIGSFKANRELLTGQ